MRLYPGFITIAATLTSLSAVEGRAQETLAIRNVTLVDVTAPNDSLARKPETTVIWKGENIVAVGPSRTTRIPRGAVVMDGRGHYLIPGLWDMHVHQTNLEPDTAIAAAYYLPLPIAFGVTTVRNMAGPLSTLVAWRDAINNGTRFGPRMFVTGQKLGLTPVVPGAPAMLRSEADIERSISMLASGGADFIKVQGLKPGDVGPVSRSAKAHGLSWGGHVEPSTPVADIVRAGLTDVEHLTGVLEGASDSAELLIEEERIREHPTLWERVLLKFGLMQRPADAETRSSQTLNDAKLRTLARLFVANHTAMGPTLRLTATRLGVTHPALRIANPSLFMRDLTPTPDGFVNANQRADLRQIYDTYCHVTRVLHEEGVVILAGSDLPTLYGVPGEALHQEMAMLNACGLSPLAALQSATLAPARFMKRDSDLGSVASGKKADMVLLADDPIASIANTRSIAAVILRGRILRKESLDSITTRAAATAGTIREKARQAPPK